MEVDYTINITGSRHLLLAVQILVERCLAGPQPVAAKLSDTLPNYSQHTAAQRVSRASNLRSPRTLLGGAGNEGAPLTGLSNSHQPWKRSREWQGRAPCAAAALRGSGCADTDLRPPPPPLP